MGQQQSSEDEIPPVDEVRENLIEIEEKIGDVLEEGQRKLDLAEEHDRPLESPVFGEECVRLRNDVIEPLDQAKKDAEQAVEDLDAGKIDAAQAQKALEALNQTLEDAESTVEDVGLEELDDEEENEDEDDEDEDEDED